MPLKDVNASSEQIAQLEASQERYRRERDIALKREQERLSDLFSWQAEDGTLWHYVEVDGQFARIIGCAAKSSTLTIPNAIDSMPVRELAVDCCSVQAGVTEVICPDTLEHIGQAAFRRNPELRRVVLPQGVDVFDYTWLRECPKLEELVLPGGVTRLDASVFYNGELRFLRIGFAAREVVPGAFSKSRLERIEVDPANDYLRTDGQALYSKDGAELIVLATSSESYDVPTGCKRILKKAFSGHAELASLTLPDSIEEIGPYGFARTGLTDFNAPPRLQSIGERAFYNCRQLAHVALNEGLVGIGDYAFFSTPVAKLEAPSTIRDIGVHIVADPVMAFGTDTAGFSIAPGARTLTLDAQGGLYRARDNGSHFVRMLDPNITEYAVAAGTRVIDERAFARHASLRTVHLPEGVEVIDPYAFKDCGALTEVALPQTLHSIGEEAFLDTSLKRIRIPASVQRIGQRALVCHGAHHGNTARSLREVAVDPGNERFFVDQGMLLERTGENQLQVVFYTDTLPSVRIPDEVTRVCDFAFNGARRLREFALSDRIRSVGTCGLAIECALELLRVDLVRPIDGHEYFEFSFPQTDRSAHEIQLAFSTSAWVNIEKIIKHYDNSVLNIHDYGMRGASDVDVYGQTHRMLERLLDPVLMTESNRSMYDSIITLNMERICVAAARNDDRRAIDALLDLGYLNEGNLMGVIDAVGTLQDAAMTGYLLEIKRRIFRRNAVDFDL